MIVRQEEEGDISSIHNLNKTVFKTEAEANLVDALRANTKPFISFVAEENKEIVGHIFFTPVTLSGHPELKLMGLAPMAVSPNLQKKGIGTQLAKKGLQECREKGFGAVVVLGHPTYYPRFGFSPSSKHGITCEFECPEEAFMILELTPDYLRGKTGKIVYHDEFKKV